MSNYEYAQKQYVQIGIDTEKAMHRLSEIPLSMHCWQGDDVGGFDRKDKSLSGGITATGNYIGKATTPEQLMQDIEKALTLIPGKHRLNLHASYAIFQDGQWADRDALLPQHFERWVDFARKNNMGIDFNPTFFSHPKATGLTLASYDENIRSFWVRHAKCCIKIAQYFANELDTYCLLNIWIPDGFKDIPADRLIPRLNLKKSLDEILATDYDKSKVYIAVESKVFGIGLESCTVGSHEFYMNYAAKNDILCLLDNGHYHPTENVADKIPSMLAFNDRLALHVTRAVRWDSDHVVRYDEATQDIANEIIRCNADKRVLIGLDYFDASINRIAAWVIGMRNMQKALLCAILTPNEHLAKEQKNGNYTKLIALQEEIKTYPVGAVWDEYCRRNNVPVRQAWLDVVEEYERGVLQCR